MKSPPLFGVPSILSLILAFILTQTVEPPQYVLNFAPLVYAQTPTVEEKAPYVAPRPLRERVEELFEAELTPEQYEKAINIVWSESKWKPDAVCDEGKGFGLVCIHLDYNDVTKEQALDPVFAAKFLIEKLKVDEEWRWTSCNCYTTMKARGFILPRMAEILPNSVPQVGSIAIFDYNGVKHISEITSIEEDGFNSFEGNYIACRLGKRFVSWDDKSLIGFWTPQPSYDS